MLREWRNSVTAQPNVLVMRSLPVDILNTFIRQNTQYMKTNNSEQDRQEDRLIQLWAEFIKFTKNSIKINIILRSC